MKSQSSFIAAAIAGVFAAGAVVSHAAPLAGTVAAEEKEGCKGKDGCKGKEKKEEEKKEEKKEGTVLAEEGKDKDKEGCPGKDKDKKKEGTLLAGEEKDKCKGKSGKEGEIL